MMLDANFLSPLLNEFIQTLNYEIVVHVVWIMLCTYNLNYFNMS
jgi:hypothetical protein